MALYRVMVSGHGLIPGMVSGHDLMPGMALGHGLIPGSPMSRGQGAACAGSASALTQQAQ